MLESGVETATEMGSHSLLVLNVCQSAGIFHSSPMSGGSSQEHMEAGSFSHTCVESNQHLPAYKSHFSLQQRL